MWGGYHWGGRRPGPYIHIYIYIIYIYTVYIHTYRQTYITIHYQSLPYITIHYITLHSIPLHTYTHIYIYIYLHIETTFCNMVNTSVFARWCFKNTANTVVFAASGRKQRKYHSFWFPKRQKHWYLLRFVIQDPTTTRKHHLFDDLLGTLKCDSRGFITLLAYLSCSG